MVRPIIGCKTSTGVERRGGQCQPGETPVYGEETSSPAPQPAVKPGAIPASPGALTLEDLIRMMGENYKKVDAEGFAKLAGKDGVLDLEDLDKDGDGPEQSEIQPLIDAGVIDQELADIWFNRGTVGSGKSDGMASKQDNDKFIEVINDYAVWMGISAAEAAAIYLKPETSFQNVNLLALLDTRKAVANQVAGLKLGKNDIKNADQLEAALLKLGYSQEVIERVIKQITDYTNLGNDDIVQAVVKVIDKARVDREIENDSITRDNLLGWLGGGAAGGVPRLSDQEINVRIESALVFEYDYRFTTADYTRRAADLIEQINEQHGPENAERALTLIAERNERESTPTYNYGLTDGNLRLASRICNTLADGYLKAGNYQKAFEYARSITGNERTQKLNELFGRCLDSIGTYYQLAIQVVEELKTGKEINYAKIAARCLESRDQRVREKAVDALNKIPAHIFTTSSDIQELASFTRLGFTKDGNETIYATDLIAFARDEIRTPIKILEIRDTVLSDPENPQLENAEQALRDLSEIIGASQEDTREAKEMRAHAFMLMAEILRAEAKGPQLVGEWPTAGGKTAPKDCRPFKMYELMARAAYRATVLFMDLKAASEKPKDQAYYQGMHIKSNNVIVEAIDENTQKWANHQKPITGAPQPLNERPLNYEQYRTAFQILAKYIPAHSRVVIGQTSERKSEIGSEGYKQSRVGVSNDAVHPADYLRTHGSAPADFLKERADISPNPAKKPDEKKPAASPPSAGSPPTAPRSPRPQPSETPQGRGRRGIGGV